MDTRAVLMPKMRWLIVLNVSADHMNLNVQTVCVLINGKQVFYINFKPQINKFKNFKDTNVTMMMTVAMAVMSLTIAHSRHAEAINSNAIINAAYQTQGNVTVGTIALITAMK